MRWLFVCSLIVGCGAAEPPAEAPSPNPAPAEVELAPPSAPAPAEPTPVPELSLMECERALAERPRDAVTRYACGLAHLRAGELHEALTQLEAAVVLAPMELRFLVTLSNLRLDLRDYEGALESLRFARELAPDDYEVQLLLGVAYRGTNQLDEAVAAYERAIAIEPGRPDAYFNLGYLFHQFRGGTIDDLRRAQDLYSAFAERAEGVERLRETYELVTRRCRRRASTNRPRRGEPDWEDGCEPGLRQQIDMSGWGPQRELGQMQETQQGPAP